MYCCDLGAIFICQKPDLKSIDEKWAAPAMLSKASWMWGRGYESFLICTLRCLKSTQKGRVPSFFLTSTTALHHGNWLRGIAPASSISRSACCSPTRICRDRPRLILLPLQHSSGTTRLVKI